MSESNSGFGYEYNDGELNASHSYLLGPVVEHIDRLYEGLSPSERNLFDLGCGNGSIAASIAARGWRVVGVDPSPDGIKQSRQSHPEIRLENGSAYDDLAGKYGQFPAVVSLEVVEHVYDPRQYARSLFALVKPGGTAIVSTPYHGYWKNLAMAMSGKLDAHFTALWDHGHIKFWSIKTLSQLLTEAGFIDLNFDRVGRVPALAKSMIVVCKKPDA